MNAISCVEVYLPAGTVGSSVGTCVGLKAKQQYVSIMREQIKVKIRKGLLGDRVGVAVGNKEGTMVGLKVGMKVGS